jgi:uncharacterized protein (TIGR03086 family)
MAGDDPFALLARAIDQTRAIISHIRPDQGSLPTPCTEWDVRALVNHTVFDTLNFTAAVSGGQRPPADADLIGTNWTDAYGTASGQLLDAWRQHGTAGVLQLGRGEVAATWVSGMHLFSETVHGWDLASATGQSTDLDPEVGQSALDFAHNNLEPFRGRGFGPEIPVSENAPLYDRLAGFCGRDPRRTPAT